MNQLAELIAGLILGAAFTAIIILACFLAELVNKL